MTTTFWDMLRLCAGATLGIGLVAVVGWFGCFFFFQCLEVTKTATILRNAAIVLLVVSLLSLSFALGVYLEDMFGVD